MSSIADILRQYKPALAGGVLLLVLATAAGIALQQTHTEPPIDEPVVASPVNPYDGIELEAEAAIVWDVTAGKPLYTLNSEAQLPLASLTKLMTALVAHERLRAGDTVTIQLPAIEEEGDSGFTLGERWQFKELLDFTLLTSSNDGARAIASVAAGAQTTFVEEMNEKSKELHLAQTFFLNPTGLDANENVSGGYGSARDVARLLGYAIEHAPEVLDATRYLELPLSSYSTQYDAENTNTEVGSIPGLIGSKTGFTDLAGGNLAVGFDAGLGYPLVVVVLGSSLEGRFTDVAALAHASLLKLSQRP